MKVAAPSWRPDIEGKADIVEEIVRIVGVDRIPSTPFGRGDAPRKPVLTTAAGAHPQGQARARGARPDRGRDLVVHLQAAGRTVRRRQAELALANPIAAELSDMRPSLIPGLVAAAQKNADRGFPDVALFEVGQIFKGDQPEDQFMAATGVRRALAKASGAGRHWSGKAADVDAFDAKADALAVLVAPARRRRRCRSCPAARRGFIPAAPAPSRSGRRTCSAISASCIRARWRRSTPKARWSPSRSFSNAFPRARPRPTRAKPVLELSAFQPVTRDFAFVVDRAVKAGDIVRAAQNVDRKLITGVDGVRRLRRRGHRGRQEVDRASR